MEKNVDKIKVDGVIIRDGHIKCLWYGTPGFGELDIFSNRDDKEDGSYDDKTKSFEVATECMGDEFYKLILAEMMKYLEEHSVIIE